VRDNATLNINAYNNDNNNYCSDGVYLREGRQTCENDLVYDLSLTDAAVALHLPQVAFNDAVSMRAFSHPAPSTEHAHQAQCEVHRGRRRRVRADEGDVADSQ